MFGTSLTAIIRFLNFFSDLDNINDDQIINNNTVSTQPFVEIETIRQGDSNPELDQLDNNERNDDSESSHHFYAGRLGPMDDYIDVMDVSDVESVEIFTIRQGDSNPELDQMDNHERDDNTDDESSGYESRVDTDDEWDNFYYRTYGISHDDEDLQHYDDTTDEEPQPHVDIVDEAPQPSQPSQPSQPYADESYADQYSYGRIAGLRDAARWVDRQTNHTLPLYRIGYDAGYDVGVNWRRNKAAPPTGVIARGVDVGVSPTGVIPTSVIPR